MHSLASCLLLIKQKHILLKHIYKAIPLVILPEDPVVDLPLYIHWIITGLSSVQFPAHPDTAAIAAEEDGEEDGHDHDRGTQIPLNTYLKSFSSQSCPSRNMKEHNKIILNLGLCKFPDFQ